MKGIINIKAYNQFAEEKMPYIVVFINNYAKMSQFLDTVVTNPLPATAITYAKNIIFAQVFTQILNRLPVIAQIILKVRAK